MNFWSYQACHVIDCAVVWKRRNNLLYNFQLLPSAVCISRTRCWSFHSLCEIGLSELYKTWHRLVSICGNPGLVSISGNPEWNVYHWWMCFRQGLPTGNTVLLFLRWSSSFLSRSWLHINQYISLSLFWIEFFVSNVKINGHLGLFVCPQPMMFYLLNSLLTIEWNTPISGINLCYDLCCL